MAPDGNVVLFLAVSHRLLSMKQVYAGMPKKEVPGTLGRRAWKRPFGLISKGFSLASLSLPPWGSVHQEKMDEDLFLHVVVPCPETKEKLPYEARIKALLKL